MKEYTLNGWWKLHIVGKSVFDTEEEISVKIPGSVYSGLLEAGKMPDPFYRDNELKALKLMENDFEFSRSFFIGEQDLEADALLLHFAGVDTLGDIYVNDVWLGSTNNMHRQWEFSLLPYVHSGENALKVVLHSPTKYIKEENEKVYTGGVGEAMEGYPHLRKAHCMFGWDWGPRLPDAGIFRDVKIVRIDEARFEDVYIEQKVQEEGVRISFRIKYDLRKDTYISHKVILITPDGERLEQKEDGTILVEQPMLWMPNGYGEQPLYTVKAILYGEDGDVLDSWERKIGLRQITVNQEKDEWGNRFAHEVNGIKLFAMGANYVPEDNLLSRVTKERTRKLLEDCVKANYNIIRVWGGGYYLEDFFYDICDELGLLVWQDFMYSCANYELDEAFEENIRIETKENVRRIRHHACLALWCGNNEMETQTLDMAWKPSMKQKADYLKLFEYIIPSILKEEDPNTFYWPSSPSAGGNYDNPWDENKGDTHYWGVWHGNEPFSAFRKHYFRYMSEFGFQAFPSFKTIESFTEKKDRKLTSRVMEMHQRNSWANGKIVNYMVQMYPFPNSFEEFVYLSQVMQAEGMRYGIEHNRRNRGRCMGTIVWQLNDIWPVASWSSIDYYGRWKALHYMEKKCFQRILISCEENGEMQEMPSCVMQPRTIRKRARLNVCNETLESVHGMVKWQLRDARSQVIESGEWVADVKPLSASWFPELEFLSCDVQKHHLTYQLYIKDISISEGTVLFTYPKFYEYEEANLRYELEEGKLVVSSDCFAKNVEITAIDGDVILSDNYFDMEQGTKIISIEEGNARNFRLRSFNEWIGKPC